MARHDLKRLLVEGEALLLADVAQTTDDVVVRNAVEVEALAARQDRLQDLLRIGSAQDKDDVTRRLLKRLEQRVERLRREHVDLVDDVNLVGAAHRGEAHRVDDFLAHIVHARARRGVELVNVRMRALGDRRALRAGTVGVAAGRTCRAGALGLLAQQRLGEDTRHGGLARTTRAAEQVRMAQAALGHRVLQR